VTPYRTQCVIPVLRIFSVEKAREFYRPGLTETFGGTPRLVLLDPFGNKLQLCEPKRERATE
jgi:hypothetical protein